MPSHARVFALCVAVATFLSLCRAPAAEPAHPFFALSNGVADAANPTPQSQAALLKKLGYDGIGPSGTTGVAEMLAALDGEGLEMSALYVGANLDDEGAGYDPGLPAAIETLKGRKTFIWLFVRSKKYKAPSAEGDARAVEVVREVARLAEASGLRVALYPHTGFYIERVEDAVRVADQVDRPNVGVTFNLCHWLKVDGPADLDRRLKLALPRLSLVTINGADGDGQAWDRLIQPLGQGSYDVFGLMKKLTDLGYRGPVGLQCYAVPGNKEENLRRFMAAWQDYRARLAAGASTDRPSKPDRWEKTIAGFEEGDRKNPPPSGGVLFVGSSSIRHWDLQKHFPGTGAINRGFGGSHVADSVHYAERIVLPYRPKVIVLYAGDNDVSAGKSPERVLADYRALVAKVHGRLPETRIVFVAIKPSLKRWEMVDTMRRANGSICQACEEDPRLVFVDIDTPMIGPDGKPRGKLFVDDGLHLSDEGYELWSDLVRPHLK